MAPSSTVSDYLEAKVVSEEDVTAAVDAVQAGLDIEEYPLGKG